jgi:hypothetical protein
LFFHLLFFSDIMLFCRHASFDHPRIWSPHGFLVRQEHNSKLTGLSTGSAGALHFLSLMLQPQQFTLLVAWLWTIVQQIDGMINESIWRLNGDHNYLIINSQYWYSDAVMIEKVSEAITIA